MIISEEPIKITGSNDIAHLMWNIINAEHETDQEREHFWVIGLNTKNTVKYIELTSLGIVDRAFIHPRETFRLAIMRACKSIIVCHNHPSGDPMPSPEDRHVTETLKAAGKILGISVIDHIIIGRAPEYYSLAHSELSQQFKTSTEITAKINTMNGARHDADVKINLDKSSAEKFDRAHDEIRRGIDEIKAALDKRAKSNKVPY